MRYTRTITSNEMRGINRTAVLDIVRREGPISRTEIAERLKLSVPTVMRIVDELTAEQLIRATGSTEWSGGRRRSLVEFNASGHLAIGVDMGGTKVFGALSDLSGKIFKEITIPNHGTQGEDSYRLLCQILGELVAEAEKVDTNLLGIGVGVPGTVSDEDGLVYSSGALKWKNFPVVTRLVNDFHMPVVVDNDVNLAALGELWFGAFQSAANLVLITVGTGIGAGIIVDGSVYRGTHQTAGEIGFVLPCTDALNQTYEGFGALERLASGTGIAARARQALSGGANSEITAEDVFEAARRGEAWAKAVVAETVDLLAMGISAVSICFDPDVIILGGGVARSADLLIEPIRARLDGRIPVTPNLAASTLGYRAGVMGTIVNLLYHTSDFYVVRKLS